MEKMKAGAYYRVSTKDTGQDVAMQRKAVRDYCNRENIEIIKEYEDFESGSKESRPEFDKLLSAMRDKEIDCIVVYKLDRLGRSLSHLVKLFEEFDRNNIKFVSVTQAFKTTTPEGKLMLQMMMILAEYERTLTIARVKDGLEEAKAKGKKLGRPKGSKDKGYRKKSGYYNRFSKKNI